MFYDPHQFPFTRSLEQHWREIYRDYLRVRQDLEDYVERKLYEEGWKVFKIFDYPHGEPIQDHIEKCPFTAALIRERFPHHGAAGFSVLQPMTRIKPHEGYQGEFLRCHLGLKIPQGDCALRLMGDTRRWQEGRVLVFDDRVTHEAWNLTDEDRVILLVDFIPER